jgi:hypothetical protein
MEEPDKQELLVHKVTPATLVQLVKWVAQAKLDRQERRAMQVLKVFWE